jgi:hypothetical protein
LLAAVVVTLVVAKQKRALVLLALAAVPVLLFAVHWQGGDLERYLPLYPFLFVAIAVALSEQMSPMRKYVCAALLVTMAATNVGALSRYSYCLREAYLSRRASTIPFSRLTKSSVLFEGDPVADSNAGIRVNEVDGGFYMAPPRRLGLRYKSHISLKILAIRSAAVP